jgi:xanthine dehydrogenase accessory factor
MTQTQALYNEVRKLVDTGHRSVVMTTLRNGESSKKVYTEDVLDTLRRTAEGEAKGRTQVQFELEELQQERRRIVVTALPAMVDKGLLMEEMAAHVKNRRIDGIAALRDESGADNVRIVIELKAGADAAAVLDVLQAAAEQRSASALGLLTALETGELQYAEEDGAVTVTEPYCPESRLVVLGGGHIALPLVEFAARCGFAVTVVDDRPSFANRQRFPAAREVMCESFERCFDRLHINRFTFVVVITRGHRHDLDCLRQILRYDTAYTGMIGSRRRVTAARRQLLEEGFPGDKLDAVRAPIGLDIGAETPEEIAVSILSEVISYKRKMPGAVWPELDLAVLKALCDDTEETRALVTVVGTKGSTPREAGAKMIVHSDGRIIGSIGGGCSESGVISEALDIIRDGGFKIVDVDMTGDVAEDEGMVCGGIMKVIIEQI